MHKKNHYENNKSKAIRHLVGLLLSLSITFIIARSGIIPNFLEQNRQLILLTAFISGVLFTSGFTSIPASASLFILGQNSNPFLISIIAAGGSVFGDILILRIFKNEIEITENGFLNNSQRRKLKSFLILPIIKNFTILLAFIIIGSPLPDELGLGLLGIVEFKPRNFIFLSFILNFLGILSITNLGGLIF